MKLHRILFVPALAVLMLGGASLAPAQQAAEAAEPPISARGGELELEQLTEQVIDSLKKLDASDQQGDMAARGDLFRTLNSLVEKAIAEGKTSEDVLQLIEEALDRKGGVSLEELLGRGDLDLRQLLRRLVERAAARAATPQDAYTRALLEEGNATRVDGGAGVRTVATASGGSADYAAATRVITVQPGDTLGTLARRYYGDATMWRRIYEANRDRISNPDLLLAGQRIRIP